jgi:glycosyltransferase involved in cell wall biosynthesis
MLISVVICTYNRATIIGDAIISVINQTIDRELVEIIIVDNGSTDNTRQVIEKYYSNNPINIHYVIEPSHGLSTARNTGASMAQGEIIAYIDDDAIAEPEWLIKLLEVYEYHKDAWIVGGKIKINWEVQPPEWLHPAFWGFLGQLEISDCVKPIKLPERIGGGNFSIRRDALQAIGQFSTKFGRNETNLLSGEEVELMHRVEQKGGKIYYTPHAIVWHLGSKNRMQKRFFKQRVFWEKRGQARLDNIYRQNRVIIINCLRELIRLPYHFIRMLIYYLTDRQQEAFLRETFIWGTIGYCTGAVMDRHLLRKD